jgi:anti-anti-sigma factor
MAAEAMKYEPVKTAGEPGAFRIDVRTDPRSTTVYLTGDLDFDSSQYLESVLGEFEGGRPDALVIDMAELDFMDITGLHVISKARRAAARAGRPITVCNSSDQVQHLFDLVAGLTAQDPADAASATARAPARLVTTLR